MKNNITVQRAKTLCVSALSMAALATVSLADDITSGHSALETMEQETVEHKLQVNPGFTYVGETDFKNDRLGKMGVWRLDLPARYTMKTEAGDLGIGAFYEFSEYHVEDLIPTGYNYYDFNTLAFDTYWKGMIDDNWGYFVYGAVGLSSSTHVGFGTGLTGMGGGGAQYVWSKDLSLGIGALVATQMEDDPRVLPIIALNWQINERWALRTLRGVTVSYDVTGDKKFVADLGVSMMRREYRIDPDVAMTDNGWGLELGGTYRFSEAFALRGAVGALVGRNIQAWDNGDKLTQKDVESAPYVSVRALLTF